MHIQCYGNYVLRLKSLLEIIHVINKRSKKRGGSVAAVVVVVHLSLIHI